jgi:hypothetical protein
MATLDSTLGAIEVGSFFSICLFGVLCAQVYYYYMTFRGESTVLDTAVCRLHRPMVRLLKSSSPQIAIIWYVHYYIQNRVVFMPRVYRCLDLGQTICITHATYVATITWYGHASHIDSLITIPSMPLSVLFSSLVEIAVRVSLMRCHIPTESTRLMKGFEFQVVFIKRLMEFSGSRYAPGLCYILATATFGGGIWLCVVAFQAKTTSGLVGEFKWLYIAAMSGIVISDMLIAATLCYYLRRSQRWLGR